MDAITDDELFEEPTVSMEAPETEAPETEAPETATCYLCHCESLLVGQFRKTPKGLVCPSCLPSQAGRDELNAYAILLAGGALFSLIFRTWAPLLNIAVYIIVIWLTVCAHEAIHALTAVLLGGWVFELAIGAGRRRYSFEWRGTRFSLRSGLFMGLCIAAFPQRRLVRVRWLIYVMTPLAVQIMLVLWLLPSIDLRLYLTQVAVLETVVIVNVVIIATNLYPRRISAVISSDGAVLLDLLRGRKTAEALRAMYYLLESSAAIEREDYPAMLVAAEAGVALDPQDELLKNNLAAAYLAEDRHAEALAMFDRFLEEQPLTPSVARGMYQCNRAAALFQLALGPAGINQAQRAEAQAAAAEAYLLLPWESPVRVQHAVSTYYAGKPQVALEQLIEELPLQDRHSDRAEVLAEMALVQHALGQSNAAHDSLAEAWRIYPKGGYALTRIGALVGYPAPAGLGKAERTAVDD